MTCTQSLLRGHSKRKRKCQAEPEDQESDCEETTERRLFFFLHFGHFHVGHCFGLTQTQYELYYDSRYGQRKRKCQAEPEDQESDCEETTERRPFFFLHSN